MQWIFQFYASGVRFHTCLFYAPANARLGSPLSPVWKDLLKTVAVERTHADAHRRKAVRVSHLWKILLRQVKPESSPSDSRGCKSEKMILCFIHNSLHSLSTATHVEKNLHSSPIWWNTKRRDAPAQQLRFWKCVCEENYTREEAFAYSTFVCRYCEHWNVHCLSPLVDFTSDYCYPDLLNTSVWNKSFKNCKVHFTNVGSFKC